MISTPQVSDNLVNFDSVPFTHIPASIDEEQQEANVPNNAHVPQHIETNDIIHKPEALLDALLNISVQRSIRDQQPFIRYSEDEYVY